ncbi:DUF4397 domain-containing protein [Paracidobacterium acidisoli]|uniref:DUF4397 domain-containing protein n=1 Tax=Paracidobacterium acidisoli TaxID=2303751 RepID=UPI001314BD0F|nr:DUF4397 domain-containing protein [Paracidobacterium acidisoli]
MIDASYHAPALNVSIGGSPIAANIVQGSITNYAILGVQTSQAQVYPVKSTTAAISVSGAFGASEQHSVYITDTASGYTATVLEDQNTAAPSGYASVRFLQQAIATGPVDIYLVPSDSTLADTKAVLAGTAAGTATNYINVPADSYTLVVTAAGSITSKYTASLTLNGGAVRTLLIMDQQLTNNPPVTVVTGNDLN